MRVISHSYSETLQIAKEFSDSLCGGEILAFHGGLGMGKTAFTAGVAAGLGITVPVTSPTFTIMNSYPGRLTLYHFDVYRIADEDALYATGFFDFAGQPGSVTAIEWSENIRNWLPEGWIEVKMEQGILENDRIITITGESL